MLGGWYYLPNRSQYGKYMMNFMEFPWTQHVKVQMMVMALDTARFRRTAETIIGHLGWRGKSFASPMFPLIVKTDLIIVTGTWICWEGWDIIPIKDIWSLITPCLMVLPRVSWYFQTLSFLETRTTVLLRRVVDWGVSLSNGHGHVRHELPACL